MSGKRTGWADASLAQLGEEIRGSVVPSAGATYELYSVPAFPTRRPEVLDGSEIRSAKRPVRPGDVLLCKINPRINRVWIVAEPLEHGREQIASTEYLVIRTADSDLSRYVMWYLQSPVFRDWIKLSAEGATGSHTRAKSGPILRQRIPLPPVNEQRRIVEALEEQFSRLDAADDSLRRAEHRLESFRTSVVAAATAGYPSVELGALVSELRYGTSIKCLYDGAGLPVIRIPNIVNCRVDMSDLKFATDSTADLSSAIVAEGDLLFVRTNGSRDLIGRVAVVHHVEATAFASYLIRARPDRTKLEPRYAAVALSTPVARALIEARAATTAGQYNLNQQALRSLPIPLPPLAEQQRIIALVEQQLSVIEAMRRSTETARDRSSALRRSILERAFRGELVPQDPCDEPASALVARMAVEHATASPIRRRKVLR